MMFKSAPGKDGATLVPDLAESLGHAERQRQDLDLHPAHRASSSRTARPSRARTSSTPSSARWTRRRSPTAPRTSTTSSTCRATPRPYEDTEPGQAGPEGDRDPRRPDDRVQARPSRSAASTTSPSCPSTIPVPQAKDTGSKYKEHVVSTGPYMFDTNDLGKSFALVRNPNWDQATDPNRKPLPDRIEVALNVNADDIDNRLLVRRPRRRHRGHRASAARRRAGSWPTRPSRRNTDNAAARRGSWFTSINGEVAPLDNIHCRKAVRVRGRPDRLPARLRRRDRRRHRHEPHAAGHPGRAAVRPLPVSAGNTGDLAKAKDELNQCGQPNGFTTGISYRAERPKEKATAEALQQSLAARRDQARHQALPDRSTTSSSTRASRTSRRRTTSGIMVYGWGADWPDGFGFLSQIVDSRVDPRHRRQHEPVGVVDPAVDALLDKARHDHRRRRPREQIWVDVDKKVMDDAFILPGIWAKGLLYRPHEPDERVHHRRLPDVRLPGAGHDPEVGEGLARGRP